MQSAPLPQFGTEVYRFSATHARLGLKLKTSSISYFQIQNYYSEMMRNFVCPSLLGAIFISCFTTRALAVPLIMSPNPNPYSERNADGSRSPLMRLIGHGEIGGCNATVEVTVDGFTVKKIQGTYMYLELNKWSRTMVSSGLVAGRDDPRKSKSKISGKMLNMNEHASMPIIGKIHLEHEANKQRRWIASIEKAYGIPNVHSHVMVPRRAAVTGNKKNLMVAFKFSDHASRVTPSTADLSVLMNNVGPHPLCPTGSVRDVYLASSFHQLILDTTVTPWVTLPNSESYYANGNSGLSPFSHTMIKDALEALQQTGFDFSPFDNNNDGFIDAIGFFHSGYGAEWGGTDAYGSTYVHRIWSHKWSLISLPGGKWTSSSGKSVYDYHVSPSLWGTSGSAIGRIGVIAHETGHFFGLPDLYDGSGGSGIGSFCLMANSWGFDSSQLYPPHISAWSKVQLGWVTPTVITTPGTYTARKACAYPDVFQIRKNFPLGEYLLIENRQRCKFDAIIPGPGLAIFHIDDSTGYTAEGYPGQSGWPTNGNHYRVALLQADGAYNLERGTNRGDSTDLFFHGGVNSLTSLGTSTGSTYPNTKAYKGGIISETGLSITNIGASSDSMSFVVTFRAIPPTPAPVMPPMNQFSLTILTDGFAQIDTAWTLFKISSKPPRLIDSRAIGFYGDNFLYTEIYNLTSGRYQFNLTDAYGDGFISPGYYMISLGGVVLKSGGSFTFLDSVMFYVPTAPVVKPAPIRPVVKPVRPAVKPVRPLSKPAPSLLVAKPSLLQPLLKPVPMKLVIKLMPVKPVQMQPAPTKPAPKIVKNTSVPFKVLPSKTLSKYPSKKPSRVPSKKPVRIPSKKPSRIPSKKPSRIPSKKPSRIPSKKPSRIPSKKPSIPSKKPSNKPSTRPTKKPSAQPVVVSTTAPSDFSSAQPT